MKLGWIYDRRFREHDTGPSHVERAERLDVIAAALAAGGWRGRLEPLPFRAATAAELALVHEPAYVDLVRMMCAEGFTFIGTQDTAIGPRSYDVAALAAGGVLAACDAVMAGRVRRAFCAVRPPGHHAEADRAAGFCLFNHVALAAEHVVRHHGLSRIAVVDFDAHHGNGTQAIFEARPDVYYISLHERPATLPFPGSGEAAETGTGAGQGYTRNVPLDAGSGDAQYRAAFDAQVLPALDAYRPEFVLVSAGFDALMGDRVAHLSLEPASYSWITARLVAAAEQHAAGRLVSVLEGGYDLAQLGAAVVAHVAALAAGLEAAGS